MCVQQKSKLYKDTFFKRSNFPRCRRKEIRDFVLICKQILFPCLNFCSSVFHSFFVCVFTFCFVLFVCVHFCCLFICTQYAGFSFLLTFFVCFCLYNWLFVYHCHSSRVSCFLSSVYFHFWFQVFSISLLLSLYIWVRSSVDFYIKNKT